MLATTSGAKFLHNFTPVLFGIFYDLLTNRQLTIVLPFECPYSPCTRYLKDNLTTSSFVIDHPKFPNFNKSDT